MVGEEISAVLNRDDADHERPAVQTKQAPILTTCLNCSQVLDGDDRYCRRCGQQLSLKRLTFDELTRSCIKELLSTDGPWLTTLGGLFPHLGAMAAAYMSGQRARFVNPVRFLIVMFALFFAIQAGLALSGIKPVLTPSTWLPIALLAYAPVMAVLLRLLFTHSGRTLAEITCFLLYLLGVAPLYFGLVSGLVLALGPAMYALNFWFGEALSLLLLVLLPVIYTGASAARFFATGWAWAALATSAALVLLAVVFSTSQPALTAVAGSFIR